MPATTAKVLFTGKTHTTGGPTGATRSEDGFVDVRLPQPHPAAENLFASAWSACYLGALDVVANERNIKPTGHPFVDTQIDLHRDGEAFFLSATLTVTIPGIDRPTAESLADAAHAICPYSKAVHGNIEITTTIA